MWEKIQTKSHSPIVLDHAQNKHEFPDCPHVHISDDRRCIYVFFFSSQMNLLHYLGFESYLKLNTFFPVCRTECHYYHWHFEQHPNDEWIHFTKWYFFYPNDDDSISRDWVRLTLCHRNLFKQIFFQTHKLTLCI